MLYLIAIVLGILVGTLAGGKASNLMNLRFEKAWMIISAFIIQVFAQVIGMRGFTYVAQYSLIIQGGVFCLLLYGFWSNRHYLGIWVIGMGCALNALVMMLNGGKMPVSYDALVEANFTGMLDLLKSGADGKHILMDQSTKLAFLSDIIVPPRFLGYLMQVVSIGDLVVALGVFTLILCAVIDKKLNIGNGYNIRTGGNESEKIN